MPPCEGTAVGVRLAQAEPAGGGRQAWCGQHPKGVRQRRVREWRACEQHHLKCMRAAASCVHITTPLAQGQARVCAGCGLVSKQADKALLQPPKPSHALLRARSQLIDPAGAHMHCAPDVEMMATERPSRGPSKMGKDTRERW